MAILWKGSTAAHIESIETNEDAFNGSSTVVTWVGTETAIYGIANSYRNNKRVSARTSHEGPVFRVVVTYGSANYGEGEDDPVDTWTVSVETLEKDGFQAPNVNLSAQVFGAHEFRKQIEDALASGSDLDPAIAGVDWADEMLFELARGATHYEDNYTVLKCRRVLPADAVGKFAIRSGPASIYQTPQLPVPNNILGRLPGLTGNAFPDDPPNSRWGWKPRGPTCEFIGRKAEINVEFVCAAWSTTYYPDDSESNFTF